MSRRTLLQLAAIVLLAFLLRLAWVTAVPTQPDAGDAFGYHRFAQTILDGHGFSRATIEPDGTERYWPTAFYTPGYPHFLAGLYSLTGVSVAAAHYANVVLGTLTVVAVFVAARRLVPIDVALVAGLLVAVMPSLVIWTSPFMTVTLATFLFSVSIALVLWSRVENAIDLRLVLLAAAVIAVTVYVRSEGLLLLPAAIAWLAFPGRSTPRLLPASLLLCIVTVALISPWTVRNYVKLDAFIPTSSSAGDNVYQGHSDCATGTWAPGCSLNKASHGGEVEAEVFANREGVRQGLRYAFSHPLREVQLTAVKLFWLWKPSTDAVDGANSRDVNLGAARLPLKLLVGGFGLGFGLLVIAGLFHQRREVVLLPAALILAWSLGYIPFVAISRYSVPVLPALAILAAAELVWLGDVFARRLRTQEPTPESVSP